MQFIHTIILFFLSLSLRFILVKSGQTWIKTKSHTATLTILPLVTFVITKVISGNIALSLGMVGALSIVRFRNPVRSPLELTVYFTSITMGITSAVSINWLLFLSGSIYIFSSLLYIISYLSKKLFRKEFFINSFSEGSSLSTLEIESSLSIKRIENSRFLKSISFSNGKNLKYLLAASEFRILKDFILSFENEDSIISYHLNEG
tara:strand:- start:19 stop:633 length:615 start_codon:yes stop_codon:yes gene_type:complete